MSKSRANDLAGPIYKTGEQSQESPFTFVMSSEAVDRTGDIIVQSGWDLRQFKKNPIALFGHTHSFPVGHWKNVRVDGKRLMGDLHFAERGTSQRIDEIRSLVEQRILRAVSVGFKVHAYEPIDKDDPWGAWRIMKAELLETSVVSVPAHQDALLAASADMSRSTQKALLAGMLPTPETESPLDGKATFIERLDLGAHSDDIRASRLGY